MNFEPLCIVLANKKSCMLLFLIVFGKNGEALWLSSDNPQLHNDELATLRYFDDATSTLPCRVCEYI